MIRLPPRESLTGLERYGLDLLVDLARLPPVEDPTADVVRLSIAERDPGDLDLRTCAARDWYLEAGDGEVRVPRIALRRIAECAGATAEQRATNRDRHGRVPSEANVTVQNGLDAEPVVSRAGVRLREAVVASAGRRPMALLTPWPGGKRWGAALTHDLDVVAFWPVFTALRVAELSAKGELRRVAGTLRAALAALGRDPVRRGVLALLERERKHGIVSTWFVLCETPTLGTMRAGDVTYAPDSRAAAGIVRELTRRGCEIGLHGSFATSDRHELFGEQRARLERLSGSPVLGVRQHFLRMRPGVTEQGMAAAGFRYDATWGFPDRNGFRLGVADVIPVWDAQAGRPLDLEEVPLCWMDRALSKYRGVEDPGTWVAEGLARARACRDVEGLWVGVWHPNLTPALGFPGGPPAFGALVERLAADDPFFATLSAIVEWRVARRSMRIRAIAPDGRVATHAAACSVAPVTLESPAGHVLDAVTARAP